MAILRVNATREGGIGAADGGGDWRAALAALAPRLAPGAPVTVLVHGYRFSWRRPAWRETCAQALLYRDAPVPPSSRRRPALADWPARLGFAAEGVGDGLCIAFGWDARRGRLASLARHGVNDFALVYRDAEAAGSALAALLDALALLRPDLAPGILAHSLGARVALAAIRARPSLRLGRVVLLGAAEYAGVARQTLARQRRAGGRADFLSVTSRANDVYDALFAAFAPRPAAAGDGPLGWACLGDEAGNWHDLQLDHPATARWLAARGLGTAAPVPRVSHWHFYACPRAMALWRAVLRAEPGWQAPTLARLGLPGQVAAPFAHLGRGLPRPLGPGAGLAGEVDALAET